MVFRPSPGILAIYRHTTEIHRLSLRHVRTSSTSTFKNVINPTANQQAGMHSSEKPCPKSAVPDDTPPKFKPSRVLVLSKITRYEFEKRTHPHLTEEELSEELAKKGSDYRRLKDLHDYHIGQARKIVNCLKDAGIETQIANRYEYGAESIKWADAIFTAGGDGTYLLGASKLRDNQKPLIGINTDPRRSEGYLCLPKAASLNFRECLDKLLNGQFKWFHRQRIRIELSGPNAADPPIELHEQQFKFPEHRFTDWMPDIVEPETDGLRPWQNELAPLPEQFELLDVPESCSRILPEAALNEVFIGESLSSRSMQYGLNITTLDNSFLNCVSLVYSICSLLLNFNNVKGKKEVSSANLSSKIGNIKPARLEDEFIFGRVSYYEISVNDGPSAKQKSSGVTVCTGTGSTSWSFNINKLTQQATSSIIRIIGETSHLPISTEEEYAAVVTRRFNEELVFDPSDKRMSFTIRDPVSNTIYSASDPRGFAQKVMLKSRCYDASLVIDGGASYKFNDGAIVMLTVHPDDSLKTVELL